MAEKEIVEFDEVYDPDIENAQQRENQATSRETRDFVIFLREKRTFSTSYLSEFLQRFDSLITHAPILELVKSYSSGLIETSVIRLEPEWVALEHHYKFMQSDFGGNLSHPILEKPLAYCLVDKDMLFVCGFIQKGSLDNHLFRKYSAIQPESCCKWVQIAMGAARGLASNHHASKKQVIHKYLNPVNLLLDDNYRDLKASNMSLDRNVKSTSKFKNHAIDAGDFTALNIPPASPRCRKTDVKIEKTSQQSRSYLHKICPMKVRNESQCNIYHVSLLISTLLATITFHTALKLYLPGCRFQEGYESSSSVNSVCQIENQSSYSNRMLITFNSVVFFLSTALMMILFSELPFRPWLLVLVLSMVGSYICTFMDPINPSSFSS